MQLEDYGRQDRLDWRHYSAQNPAKRGVTVLRRLFEAFARAGGLAPTRATVEGATLRFDVDKVAERVAKRKSAVTSVTLSRENDPGIEYMLSLDTKPETFRIWALCPLDWFATHREATGDFIELVRAVSEITHATYSFAHSGADMSLGSKALIKNPAAPIDVHEAYWLNVIGPDLAERLGPERVRTAPAPTRVELPYGGVLLLTSEQPTDVTLEPARRAQAEMLAHLKETKSVADVFTGLMTRSEALTPVAPAWDPDMTPVFELVVKNARIADRPRLTADFNRLGAPEPTEWVRRTEARPADVDNVEQAIENLEGDWAEKLVMALHTRVPELMEGTPESLAMLDYLFADEGYAESMDPAYLRDKLVPMIGAYLGKVMVRSLKGTWVPRRDIMETQVIVGNRAWLPVLRASRFLQSKAAALEFSLTKFCRTAKKHA